MPTTSVTAETATPARPRSPDERRAFGRAARKRMPLDALADLPAGGPPEDAVSILRAEDPGRVPELLPIRYGRMAKSALAFYRGSAAVMATDLAAGASSGLTTQLCGDAHLSNFGVFATPERRLVFDVNDFDETLPGPFEWDVKRLAASLELAGRANGFAASKRRRAVREAVSTYRTAIHRFAEQDTLRVWYARLDVERLLQDLSPRLDSATRKRGAAAVSRAWGRDQASAVRKLTTATPDGLRFAPEPPLMVPLGDLLPAEKAAALRRGLAGLLCNYRETLTEDRRRLLDEFHVVDVARKVVGVGSVGTRSYILLLTTGAKGEAIVLQAKEAGQSVLEAHLGPSRHASPAQRVVEGQRLIQAASDLFLGWQESADEESTLRHYYIRQLRDAKTSADVGAMRPRGLRMYGQMCAWTLARAHARSGDRLALAAYLGQSAAFEAALTEFASAYANRTERQLVELQAAIARGDVDATDGI